MRFGLVYSYLTTSDLKLLSMDYMKARYQTASCTWFERISHYTDVWFLFKPDGESRLDPRLASKAHREPVGQGGKGGRGALLTGEECARTRAPNYSRSAEKSTLAIALHGRTLPHGYSVQVQICLQETDISTRYSLFQDCRVGLSPRSHSAVKTRLIRGSTVGCQCRIWFS